MHFLLGMLGKQGDAVSPLPFNFALEQIIGKAKKARENGTEWNIQLLSMLAMLVY
jgi:hypothetical protein